MRKLYVKLAAVNIRNNRQLYLPYLLAGVFSAAMFYLVQSIQDNPGLDQMRGGANVAVTLLLGVIIVGLFAAIFLFYTNSFIMKRRKRELSVYNILGMEKKHIAKVLFLEMLFTAAVTIGGGTRRRLLSGAYGGGRSLCHYHVFCGGAACDSGNVLSVYRGQYCGTETASEK